MVYKSCQFRNAPRTHICTFCGREFKEYDPEDVVSEFFELMYENDLDFEEAARRIFNGKTEK